MISTSVFAVVAVARGQRPGLGTFPPGFPRFNVASSSFSPILGGLWLNLRLLAVTEVVVLVVALFVASLRTLRSPVLFPFRALATAYVDFFRGLPLIILLYLVGFGLPSLRLSFVPTDPTILGGIALVLCYGAYVAEVFRSGIDGVHPSQRNAAASLGLSPLQTMRLVVLPQAVRRVLPPCSTTLSRCRRTWAWCRCWARSTPFVRPRSVNAETLQLHALILVAGLMFIALAVPSGRLGRLRRRPCPPPRAGGQCRLTRGPGG